jgi:5'-3' exonuclease
MPGYSSGQTLTRTVSRDSPRKALKLIREYGSLESVLQAIKEEAPPTVDLSRVRRIFLDPEVVHNL